MIIGEKLADGFSLIALKKLNMMIARNEFVGVASVDENGVTIQYKRYIQRIDKFGNVHNDDKNKPRT